MEIVQIISIAIVGSILAIIIKQQKPEFGVQVGIVTGVLILLMVVGKIAGVMEVFKQIASKANIDSMYLNVVLKIIVIAYLAEFGIQVCKDAGENVIAAKVELASKILLLATATPVITALLEVVTKLLT